jgi:hypothetical protein
MPFISPPAMTFDDQLKRAFDTLSDRLRDELDRQVHAAMDELSASARREADGAAAAAVAALPPPVRVIERVLVPDTSAAQHLVEGVRAIDGARTLTGVLDALITAVAHDGVGAGIWLLRGGRLHCWRSIDIQTPTSDILLDDREPHHRAIAEAARTNASCVDDGIATPLAISGQVVAVLWAVNGSPSTSQSAPSSSLTSEVLARHAARCLESITAFKTARAMADKAAETASTAANPVTERSMPHVLRMTPSPDAMRATPDGQRPTAEEHEAAQRYARLLVSEIRLYHEQAVIEGRRDRDLATRLGGEIARARVMYEQRVPPHVRDASDHFHQELVRTLAEGDGSLLEMKA